MKLTIIDIAQCLQVPKSTVERWIRQGRIPIQRSGTSLIFNDAVLEKWAANHNLPFKKPQPKTDRRESFEPESLLSVMKRGGVFYDIRGDDSDSVLKAAVQNLSGLSEPVKAELYRRLLEREHLTSTGIGKGVAIPHPHDPLSESISEPLVSTCFLEKPLEFGAVDDKPVFVMFVLISPTIKIHLHLLSRLSFCVRSNKFVDFLKTGPEPDALFSQVGEFESQIDKAERF